MIVYTPDECLHRAAAQQAQRDKYLWRRLTGQQPRDRKIFARQMENAIADRLRAAGYVVVPMPANEHFDLLVNGLRVEVKAAALSHGRYQAALRSNQADVLILACRSGEADCYFIIPFELIAGRTHIEIRNADPSSYAGRLAAWREAWHVIDQRISAGPLPYQTSLEMTP